MKQADKQYRMALSLVVLFAAVLLGYIAYQRYGPKDDDQKPDLKTENISVLTNKKESISEFNLKTTSGSIAFTKNVNGIFIYKEKPDIGIESSEVNNILDTISSLSATSLISENASNLSDFGLSDPKSTISYLVDGKPGKTILVGDKALEKGYYLRLDGENKVYMIDVTKGDYLLSDLGKLRDKKVINFKQDVVETASIIKAGATVFEASMQNTSSSSTPSAISSNKWVLTKPYEFSGDNSQVDRLFSNLNYLKIKDFIPANSVNLSELGLESPYATLTLVTRDKEKLNLLFGNQSKEDGRYAMRQGSNEVWLLEKGDFTFIDYSFKDMADKAVVHFAENPPDSIDLSFGSDKLSILIAQNVSKSITAQAISINGVQATDKTAYSNFIESYVALTASNIEPKSEISGNPELSINAKTKTSADNTSFVKKSDSEYYVLKDGKYNGQIISKADFDKLLGLVSKVKPSK